MLSLRGNDHVILAIRSLIPKTNFRQDFIEKGAQNPTIEWVTAVKNRLCNNNNMKSNSLRNVHGKIIQRGFFKTDGKEHFGDAVFKRKYP